MMNAKYFRVGLLVMILVPAIAVFARGPGGLFNSSGGMFGERNLGGGFQGGGFQGGSFQGTSFQGSGFQRTPFRQATPSPDGFLGAGIQVGGVAGQTPIDRGGGATGVRLPTDLGGTADAQGPSEAGLRPAMPLSGERPGSAARATAELLANAIGQSVETPAESAAVPATASRAPSWQTAVPPGRTVDAVSPTALRAGGMAIRRGPIDRQIFTEAWYTAHPTAWHAAGLVSPVQPGADWSRVNAWFQTNWPANYYDYGNALTFVDELVCFDGQPVATAADYATAASILAAKGAAAADEKEPWLPLGVFALTELQSSPPAALVQLAVNRAGIVRGTYCRPTDQATLPLQGAIDRGTQRIAWTVGRATDVTFDTGLYNLMRDETIVLVHFGTQRTQQYLLVRTESTAQKR